MIVYTKVGQKNELDFLTAVDRGVFSFRFNGETTVVDPADSSVWTWGGVTNAVDEVLGVSQGDELLTITISLNDCISLQGSFFWDDADGVLYVHYFNSTGDWAIDRSLVGYSAIVSGYASGYSAINGNVFDGVFYESLITQITGLSKSIDPTKLSLVAFDEATMTLSDEKNQFTHLSKSDVVGVPIWIYYIEENATDLTNSDRIFTGYLNGYTHNRDSIVFQIIEQRFFQNRPACPNILNITDYPNAGKNAGKVIPTAWGDIRRGKMILTNGDTLSTAASGNAIFLVSDPSILGVRAISKVYNKDDVEVTINTSSLSACTVEVTKPAGLAVSSLDKWKWEGEGYAITGDYNNGLDILKAAFLYLASTPYLESTFDKITWDAETAANTEAVGISLQTEKGFIEELLEPISTSLQGVVEILGDGRISWASRDTTASVSATISSYAQLDLPEISETPQSLVSELVIEYSPDFVDSDLIQRFTDSAKQGYVIKNYTIDRRDPLSPVKTILTNATDSNAISTEIMETSADPERIIKTTHVNNINTRLFGIVGIDTGLFNSVNIEYGELLEQEFGLINKTETVTIREIPDYTP